MSRFSGARAMSLAVAFQLSLASSLATAADVPLTPSQEQGKKLFHATCIYCHGEKVWGTFTLERRMGKDHALLEKRDDLVGAYVKTVIRAGLGSMPPYRRTELSDADIEAIAAYLTRLNPSSKEIS